MGHADCFKYMYICTFRLLAGMYRTIKFIFKRKIKLTFRKLMLDGGTGASTTRTESDER